MSSGCGRLFLTSAISLALLSLAISITCSYSARLSNGGGLPVLNFISELPNTKDGWELRCGNKSTNEHYAYLKAGEEDRWSIGANIGYSCDALWGNQFAYWKVYQPGVDSGQTTVYWLAKDDGLYHSWDKAKWTRGYEWEHE